MWRTSTNMHGLGHLRHAAGDWLHHDDPTASRNGETNVKHGETNVKHRETKRNKVKRSETLRNTQCCKGRRVVCRMSGCACCVDGAAGGARGAREL